VSFKKVKTLFFCAVLLVSFPALANQDIAKKITPILMLLLADEEEVDNSKVGILLDARVSGVKYKTSSGRLGTTNLNGEYFYDNEDDTVEFFLDSKKLGQTTVSAITSVLDFENGEQTAILLQSIDTDGNPNNGIQISPEVASLISSSNISVEEVDANSEDFRDKFEQVMGYPLNTDNFNAEDHAFEQLRAELVRRFDPDIFRYLSEEINIENLGLLGERPPINSVYDKNPNDYLLSYYSRLRLYFHYKYTSRWLLDDVATRDDLIANRADINARIEERSLAATELIADFYNVVGGLAATKQTLTDFKAVKHFAPLGNNTGVFKAGQLNIYDLAYDNAMNALTDDIIEQLAGEGLNILADKLPDNSPIVRILKRCVQDPIVAGVTGSKISKFAALACMSQSVGEVATEAVSIYNLIALDVRKASRDSVYFAGAFLDLFYTFGGDPTALGSIFTQMSQEVSAGYTADKFDYDRDIDTVLDIISRKARKDDGQAFDQPSFYFKDTAKESIADYQNTIKGFLATFNELVPEAALEPLEQGYLVPKLTLFEESTNTYKVCAEFKNISSFDLQNISVNIDFSSNENGFLGGHGFSINNLLVDGTSVNRCSNTFLAFPPNSELFYDLVEVDTSLSFAVDREITVEKQQDQKTYFEISRQTIAEDLAYPLITVIHPLTIEEGETLELDASGSSSTIIGDSLTYEWEYIPTDNISTINLSSTNQAVVSATMPSLPDGNELERLQFRLITTSQANGKHSTQVINIFLKEGVIPDISTGLIAHHRFDDGVIDSTRNGYDGEQFGSVEYLDGILGKAVKLNTESDYIGIEQDFDLEDFSVAFWVNVDSKVGRNNMFLSGNSSSQDNELFFNWVSSNETIELGLSGRAIRTSTSYNLLNVWTHIAISSSNGEVKLYLNGFDIHTYNFTESERHVDIEYLIVGKDQDCLRGCFESDQVLQGKIDDLRIYDRALNDSEIGRLASLSDGVIFKGKNYEEVISPDTGEIWLDRNLGANRVCLSQTDSECYGDYYQFGRSQNGHEKFGSSITFSQAASVLESGTSFILGQTRNFPHRTDWLLPGFDDDGALRIENWSKTDGTSICPIGYRVPTRNELTTEVSDLSNESLGFSSFLKLPAAGWREFDSNRGGPGYYRYQGQSLNIWYVENNTRKAYGFPVRCIKD